MSDLSNLFIVSGRLVGPPAPYQYGKTEGMEFVIKQTKEYTKKGGEKGSFDVVLQCQANRWDIDANSLTGLSTGDHVLVVGELSGKQFEKNGRVSYFTTLNAKKVTAVSHQAAVDTDIPF